MELVSAIINRRSIYSLGNDIDLPIGDIKSIINESMLNAPSPFNCQSARVVLLLPDNHIKFWHMATDSLSSILDEESFYVSENKISNSFMSAYATILFFEDKDVVEKLKLDFPTYADNFDSWSDQSSGMLQYIIWTRLEAKGLGASLQHYGNLVDSKVKSEWKLPDSWRFIAQMPFGKVLAPPDEKVSQSLEHRFIVP